MEPLPDVLPDPSTNSELSRLGNTHVFNCFVSEGCFGDSSLDTRTNPLLESPLAEGATDAEVSVAHLLGPCFHVRHGDHREVPVPVSIGIYGDLPSNTCGTRGEELQVGYLKYLCLPRKTRKRIERISLNKSMPQGISSDFGIFVGIWKDIVISSVSAFLNSSHFSI